MSWTIMGKYLIWYHHGTILDLVALNNPFEILHGWIAQSLVQSLCGIHTLDLPLRKTFLVLGDSVAESKMMFFPWIIIMQSTLMHQKKYILWTTNIKSSLSYVTQYRSIRLREVMMLVMALVMNQTLLL
jgi:hypothetical protein